MNVHCLAHVPFEDAANIGAWITLRGHSLTYTHFFKDETLPSLESFDMLVIYNDTEDIVAGGTIETFQK
ncbi:MAG: hypothetical protein ACYTEU_03160 [Planctomycetota bacterium]|jgi:hypothetical protein